MSHSGHSHRRSSSTILAAFGCLLLLTAGCIRGPVLPRPDAYRPATSHVITGLPFFPQETYQCGPASLAAVLTKLGHPTTPEIIADSIFRRDLHGTLSLDLALYPRTIGMQSRFYEGSVTDLKTAVDDGIPLVAMIDHGIGPISSYHFMVIAGYTPDAVIVNSDRTAGQHLPWDSFLRDWDRAGRWTLRVDSDTQHTAQ